MCSPTPVGTLCDDLNALASRVHQLTYTSPVTVWADEAGTWFAATPADAPPLPSGMAGTYGFMVPIDEIAADLREVLRERASDSILAG